MRCKFRVPVDYGRVLWEITNRCNYKCSYCIFSSGNKCNTQELSTSECIKVIDELYNNKFRYIKLTGGEPFIRDDIIEILKYICKKNMHVDISTNGSLLTNKLVEDLNGLNLDMLHISLDGYDANTHETLRGAGTFNGVIKSLSRLQKLNTHKRVGTVIYKHNENHLEEIIKLCMNYKIEEIIFSIMEPMGRMAGDYSLYKTKSKEELTDILELLRDKYKEITINYNWKNNEALNYCPALIKFIYINNLGQVSPCSWVDKKYTSRNTLKDYTLDELYESKEIKEFISRGCDCGE